MATKVNSFTHEPVNLTINSAFRAKNFAYIGALNETFSMTQADERRRKRSSDPLIALHYQLSYARHDGSVDTIVLADSSGLVVAGAGSWPACEELAAYAPFFVQCGAESSVVSSRIESLRPEVDVKPIRIGNDEVLLCAQGGVSRKEMLSAAARGVSRILSGAA